MQTSTGTFYGIWEKMDTRYGTALLRDGYMLPDHGYITLENSLSIKDAEIDSAKEFVKFPTPTITDLAVNGLYILTSNDRSRVQTGGLSKASVISLTGVYTVVLIEDTPTVRESFVK